MYEDEMHDKRYRIALSVSYHSRRVSFFDWWNKFTIAIGLILGSGTAMLLLGEQTKVALLAAAMITILNALALVFGFSDKARLHADLRRRFIDLETLADQGDDTKEKLEEIQAIRNQIEADEPPTKRIVSQLCAISIYRSRGDEELASRYKIPWLKQLLGHYIDFEIPAPRA